MRRTVLIVLFAAILATVVLAPAAPAAKFKLTSFSVTSGAPSSAPDGCRVSVVLNYTGKVGPTAQEHLLWQWNSGAPAEAYGVPIQASGSSRTFTVTRTNIQAGDSGFMIEILNKNGRRIAATGTTAPLYTTTAATCPPIGTSLGDWTNALL